MKKIMGFPYLKCQIQLCSVQEKDIFKERVERVACVKVRFKFL